MDSTLDRIRERGLIRIAVSFSPPPEEGHPPEFYLDPGSGEPTGVVPELGKEMAQDLSVQPEFVDLPWPEHLRALLDGEVDLLMSYTNTPQRALEVEFAGRLLPSQVVVALPRSSPVENTPALNQRGTGIGIWHGSSIAQVARSHFPHALIHEYPDPWAALKQNEVDACVVDAVTKVFMQKNPDLRLLRNQDGRLVVLAQEYGHPAVRQGDQRFPNWVENWLDYHRAQGTIGYWCGSWWESWMAD